MVRWVKELLCPSGFNAGEFYQVYWNLDRFMHIILDSNDERDQESYPFEVRGYVNENDEYGNVLYKGSLKECEEWIRHVLDLEIDKKARQK